MRDRTNDLIAYHSEISKAMTAERTSLESKLIPVSAYILCAAAEAWYRHPDVVTTIDAARAAEAIGKAGRTPGSRINAVHLWSTANIYLVGRKFLTALGVLDDEPARTHSVLDFWERAALAYRGDGHRQAWDAGFVLRPYDDSVIAALLDGARPVHSVDERGRIKRFNATLMAYLFLLYFDTRVGTGDSGPYAVPGQDGRVLLVRDFYQLGPSDFAWSGVAGGIPYSFLTAALVLDDVELRVNDWGTSLTEPEDYLDHLVGFGLFTTDGGELREVDLGELDDIVAAVKVAQRQLYRDIAGMTRDEKIACGAYVYFTFPRPLAEAAGVADSIDWAVPRDTLDVEVMGMRLYDLISPFDGTNTAPDPDETYYLPLA